MRLLIFLLCLALFSFTVCAQKNPEKIAGKSITNQIYRYTNFPSKFTTPRNVDIWLPADYSANKRYAVLYMHDGQNLFNPREALNGIEWNVDDTMARLTNEDKIRLTIVVAIWSTPKRILEFMPQKSFEKAAIPKKLKSKRVYTNSGSDDYLRFIVRELKPFIDRTYSTIPDRDNTFIMGSSMGGLMSLYAISEYPKTFGGAGCISTQFALARGIMLRYMEKRLPSPKEHKIYFDYGTKTLDKENEPYQIRADLIMKEKGYIPGVNWITRKFPGEEHSEKSWRKRVDIPLVFLLGK